MRGVALLMFVWLSPMPYAWAQQIGPTAGPSAEPGFQSWSPELPIGLSSSQDAKPYADATASLSTSRSRDHRWEGAIIGGAATAVAFGIVLHALCSSTDSGGGCFGDSLKAGALGAALGGLTGALIGGSIPRREPSLVSKREHSPLLIEVIP
jgi:hypothetical protein